MGFMMPKPKMPAAPPPPPVAPDFSAQMANRSANRSSLAALGGTFLTAGQKLGATGNGKTLLGG
jgi:hypothetical protein